MFKKITSLVRRGIDLRSEIQSPLPALIDSTSLANETPKSTPPVGKAIAIIGTERPSNEFRMPQRIELVHIEGRLPRLIFEPFSAKPIQIAVSRFALKTSGLGGGVFVGLNERRHSPERGPAFLFGAYSSERPLVIVFDEAHASGVINCDILVLPTAAFTYLARYLRALAIEGGSPECERLRFRIDKEFGQQVKGSTDSSFVYRKF